MFAQLQSLSLVVALYRSSVCEIGSFHIRLKPHTAERLPVFYKERHIMRPDFQNCPGTLILYITTKSTVKKTCIMRSQLTRSGVVGNHLGCQVFWNSAPLF